MSQDIYFQNAIDDYIKAHLHDRRSDRNQFRASELSGCVRQCVRNRLGLVRNTQEGLRRMQIGTILHRFIQKEVGMGFIGRPVEFEKEVFLQIEEIGISGHIDCYDAETVYDFKTTADLDNTVQYPVSRAYCYQLSVYAHAVGAKRAVVVYVDKKNLKISQQDAEIVPVDRIADFCRKVTAAEDSKIFPDKDECYNCKMEAIE